MFTGAQFLLRFNSVFDNMKNGVIPTAKLNSQIAEAQTEYFAPMIKAFGLNSTINAELEPLMAVATVSNPSSNIVSKTASLTNYSTPISIETTFVENGNTYSKTAQPLPPNSMKGSYTSSSVIFPRYDIVSDSIYLLPTSVACTECKVTYFRTPFLIDVTDSVTQIPYNNDAFSGILDQLLSIYGLSLGDSRFSAFEREERENSKVIIK